MLKKLFGTYTLKGVNLRLIVAWLVSLLVAALILSSTISAIDTYWHKNMYAMFVVLWVLSRLAVNLIAFLLLVSLMELLGIKQFSISQLPVYNVSYDNVEENPQEGYINTLSILGCGMTALFVVFGIPELAIRAISFLLFH